MARTITCDGCDMKLVKPETGVRRTDRNQYEVTIALSRNGHSEFSYEDIDLCHDCTVKLRKHCDVRSWPRAKVAPTAAFEVAGL